MPSKLGAHSLASRPGSPSSTLALGVSLDPVYSPIRSRHAGRGTARETKGSKHLARAPGQCASVRPEASSSWTRGLRGTRELRALGTPGDPGTRRLGGSEARRLGGSGAREERGIGSVARVEATASVGTGRSATCPAAREQRPCRSRPLGRECRTERHTAEPNSFNGPLAGCPHPAYIDAQKKKSPGCTSLCNTGRSSHPCQHPCL